jgi:hypothetical protein
MAGNLAFIFVRWVLVVEHAALMKDGGYIFHSDHSVPPDVSWDNHQYVIELVRRYGTYLAISTIIGISFGDNQ